ncbi:MAG: hypothetical protein HYR96_06060 [Deltaproteobacteria bacterium]|nr:hypothetical protein [Deltaproteobacteria bacterium]MBI3293098.1 hypothetical protein [Deltaproteobacteria bacterium]
MKEQIELGPSWDRLGDIAAKIHAIAHLISQKRLSEAAPLNEDQINYGLGEILSGLADEASGIAREIEGLEFQKRNPRRR